MIVSFQGKFPKVDPTAFVAENAMVIGDVEIRAGANIWFNCIVRGDVNAIRIGSNCSIQDACVLHVEREFHPLLIEDDVVLGHRVVAHGCKIRRGALIGIGAIVLNGAEIGEESIVGAGSVVTSNTVIPPRTDSCPGGERPVDDPADHPELPGGESHLRRENLRAILFSQRPQRHGSHEAIVLLGVLCGLERSGRENKLIRLFM
jgi:carbonic anhydrase/acetyltransferase-like protein (isoleucine patch superfamily)